MTPTDQSSEATATLPGVAVPPRSQYPVSWFECRGVVVGIGDSELFKFIDDKQIGKPQNHFEKKNSGRRCIDASTN
jgi:hypothetical protein